MKIQNFIMRILCLILIIAAVLGYNSMQKDSSEDEKEQQIASLTKRVDALEEQQEEMLTAINEAAKAREEAEKAAQAQKKEDTEKDTQVDADSKESSEAEEQTEEETEDLAYKNGTYTGEGQGFGGTITVEVTLQDDEITDIQVASAPGEDSAYLSQGKGVISSILSAQSTDVDTISGATFSSTGIINAVNDALGKAENP